MNTKTIILLLCGLGVVLFIARKLQAPESQTISQIIPVGSVPSTSGTDAHIVFDNNKTAAFQSLVSLASNQQNANVANKSLDTNVTLEDIRGKTNLAAIADTNQTNISLASIQAALGRYLGFYNYTGAVDVANINAEKETKIAGIASDKDISIANIGSDTAKYLQDVQGKTQIQLQTGYLANSLDALKLQTEAAKAATQQRIDALNNTANAYKGNSLERQGTVLNALASIFGSEQPYSYQNSFGGARPPGILQQLFPQGIGQTLTSVLGGFFGF